MLLALEARTDMLHRHKGNEILTLLTQGKRQYFKL